MLILLCDFYPYSENSQSERNIQFDPRSGKTILEYEYGSHAGMFYDYENITSSEIWSYGHKTRNITLNTCQSEDCF
jgi:hypothetical protein